LVTVEPARTANDDAVPNPTAGVAADADGTAPTVTDMTNAVDSVKAPRTAVPHRGRWRLPAHRITAATNAPSPTQPLGEHCDTALT